MSAQGNPGLSGPPELLGTALLSPPLPQGDRFQAHATLDNRRLLWHGTNVAVVAAILTSGLRIMPHSGGRVGRGIYFASENSKSAGYGEAPAAQPWAGMGTERVGPPFKEGPGERPLN